MYFLKWLLLFVLVCGNSLSVQAKKIGISSPMSTTEQLKKDQSYSGKNLAAISSYYAFKNNLKEQHHFNYGFDYNSLYFKTPTLSQNDTSSGGVARLYGTWDLFKTGTSNSGGLVFKIEDRRAYGNLAPADHGFAMGYVGLVNYTYTDQRFRTTNLYWKQYFNDGDGIAYLGFIDTADYVDVYLLVSPWTSFNNLVFATGSGTIAALPDGALGAMAGSWLDENFYIAAGLADVNNDPTDTSKGFDSFFSDFETFKSIELGWASAHENFYFNNLHLTLWQVDAITKSASPSGWGTSFSISNTYNDHFMGFLRGGYSDDGNALLERSLSTGFGWKSNKRGDVLGLGINWGRPNHYVTGSVRDQYTAELYYLWQIRKNIQITPDMQILHHPALNPNHDTITLFGVRARFVF